MPRRPWRPRRHKRLRRDESSCDPPYLKGALTDAASMSRRKGRMIPRARPCDFAKGDELRPSSTCGFVGPRARLRRARQERSQSFHLSLRRIDLDQATRTDHQMNASASQLIEAWPPVSFTACSTLPTALAVSALSD